MSDSRVDVASDSTAELIKLGETTSDSAPSKASKRRSEARDHLPDSTSGRPVPPSVITISPEGRTVLSSDAGGAHGANGKSSMQGSGRTILSDASHSQRTGSEIRSGNLTR